MERKSTFFRGGGGGEGGGGRAGGVGGGSTGGSGGGLMKLHDLVTIVTLTVLGGQKSSQLWAVRHQPTSQYE